MRFTAFLLLAILGMHQVAKAGIVFQVSPAVQQIPQGSAANFNIFISSNTPGGQLVNGVSVALVAGAGDGSGGTFAPASSTSLFGTPAAFDVSFGGAALATQVGSSILIESPVLYATLSLLTTGVNLGTYTMTFDPGFSNANNPTPGQPAFELELNGGTYEIVSSVAAVPEPTTLGLIASFAVCGAVYRRRGRRSNAKLAVNA